MHGVGAGDFAGRHERGNVQIAFASRWRADADAFIGKAHVHRIGVCGRMNRDRRYAEFPARALNA